MKKIILVLFLILGVVSFSAPNHVEVKKIEAKGYVVTQDTADIFVYGRNTREELLSIGYYVLKGENPKDVTISFSESSKENLAQEFKLIDSIETKKAYINKFIGNNNNSYAYSIVAKNQKVKDYYILILYATNKNITGNELNKLAETLSNEAESYLK